MTFFRLKKLALATVLSAAGVLWIRGGAPPEEMRGPAALARPLQSVHLHNLFQVTSNVFSGSAPENDAAFSELARLGVKTIISVDGSRPDPAAARRHGLRYVHLPVGYDGVPAARIAELTRAAQSSAGPVYVHCHHGLHRGPAAVAVICEATAGWKTNDAVAWLRKAGTGAEYPGLYRSAIEFQMPGPGALAEVRDLPEVAKTSSVVEAMVAIDEEFTRLKAARNRDWSSLPDHPDVVPAHTATILWEHLRELARSPDTAARSEDYAKKLSMAGNAANELRALLRDANASTARRDAAFRSLAASCAGCHTRYRN